MEVIPTENHHTVIVGAKSKRVTRKLCGGVDNVDSVSVTTDQDSKSDQGALSQVEDGAGANDCIAAAPPT